MKWLFCDDVINKYLRKESPKEKKRRLGAKMIKIAVVVSCLEMRRDISLETDTIRKIAIYSPTYYKRQHK